MASGRVGEWRISDFGFGIWDWRYLYILRKTAEMFGMRTQGRWHLGSALSEAGGREPGEGDPPGFPRSEEASLRPAHLIACSRPISERSFPPREAACFRRCLLLSREPVDARAWQTRPSLWLRQRAGAFKQREEFSEATGGSAAPRGERSFPLGRKKSGPMRDPIIRGAFRASGWAWSRVRDSPRPKKRFRVLYAGGIRPRPAQRTLKEGKPSARTRSCTWGNRS
jgi:hypothetical protein